MSDRYVLENLDPDLAFKIRLQISLRKNALAIGESSNSPGKFLTYISEREKSIASLLNSSGKPVIHFHGQQIYP
ncbi:MAG: hypothetical protein M1162_04310 [Candidatus Thermoplasmatota archaeon]|nr:hypothetical protein [Candidatus Thermoplasmatota archaeon]